MRGEKHQNDAVFMPWAHYLQFFIVFVSIWNLILQPGVIYIHQKCVDRNARMAAMAFFSSFLYLILNQIMGNNKFALNICFFFTPRNIKLFAMQSI